MPDAILDACAASSLLYFAAVLKPTRVYWSLRKLL